MSQEEIERALEGQADHFEIKPEMDYFTVSLSQKSGDDVLDRVLRTLQRNGGKIIAVDTERSSLLEVLESYERDEEVT